MFFCYMCHDGLPRIFFAGVAIITYSGGSGEETRVRYQYACDHPKVWVKHHEL